MGVQKSHTTRCARSDDRFSGARRCM